MILLHFLLFLLLSILVFTTPGVYFLQRSKTLSNLERIILGSVIGFVSFTLLSYFLGILRFSFLILPIIFVIDFFSFRSIFASNYQFVLPSKKQQLIILIIFILGITGQMAIIAPSGIYRGKDLVFYSSNGHDGSWHIALMEEIKKGYPLQNPIFAGEKLVNYHFFSDITPAQFSQYFKFSNLDLYFRFFPFLFSILLGSIAYLIGKRIGGSFTAGVWSTFFIYFVGSFGFFVTWIKDRGIGGESIFWATQVQSSSGNPPQIISNILVLSFLYLFSLYLSKKDWITFWSCLILAGSLVEFKVYAAVVVLSSLAITGLVQLVKDRQINILSLFIFSSLLAVALYIPNTANSTSFLIWEPWWFIRTMIVAPSHLNWLDLELKRQTYVAEGNWKRVIQIELTGFLIFFFGNLGTRFLGLLSFIKLFKTSLNNYLNQIILLIVGVSLILPLLFLQKGVASNTIQFLQYFILLFGLLAAFTITQFQNRIKSNLLKKIFIILIVFLSIPTQVGLLYDFYHKPPLAKITPEEFQALNFLKENSDKNSIILTAPYNKYLDLKIATPDIWAWSDSSYVSAFSSRRTYLTDLEQVDIMGYEYKKRLGIQNQVFSTYNSNFLKNILITNKIAYLYFPKPLTPKADLNLIMRKVFSNQEVEIWSAN